VFSRATWLALLERVGFEPVSIPYKHSTFAPDAGMEMFAGIRPA
jgi:hypothetical protein